MDVSRKILLCLSSLFLLLPFSVDAITLSEMSPMIEIEGIDYTRFSVTKTITEDEVIVTITEKKSDISYSWSFEKSKIRDKINLNFELNFDSPNKEKIDIIAGNEDKTYLSFTHHGDLPSRATVKVYVGDRYQNGEKLYLYYYNEEKDIMEYKDKDLKVKNGYVTIEIDHCSDYILTATIVSDAVNNPKSMNYIIAIMVVVILILVGATLFSTRK